jgi:hypothetical protein
VLVAPPYHASNYVCRVQGVRSMGRGGRARPRRRNLHEVDLYEPVDPNDEDWWWLDSLPMKTTTPPEVVPVETTTPPEDAPAEAETPPEDAPVEVDLEDFLTTHTATDEQISLLTQFITGAGDPTTIWANLVESMMDSIALSVTEDTADA